MKMQWLLKNRVIVLLLLLSVILSCKNTDHISLVSNGSSDYKIVVSADADSITRFAALELQKYIKTITGSEIGISDESSPRQELEIIIGNYSGLKEAGINIDGINEDGFIIKTVDKKLYIAGGTEKGTMYGVYSFLEKYLGCRKYSMDFTYVPDNKTISIGSIDERQEPAFEYRADS